METIFNLTAIKNKMKDIPRGQKFHSYFNNPSDQLTDDQKKDIISIISKETGIILNLIDKTISK